MRTESVDSILVEILEKATHAEERLREALKKADTLPKPEADETRRLLGPADRELRAGMERLRAWVETPPQ